MFIRVTRHSNHLIDSVSGWSISSFFHRCNIIILSVSRHFQHVSVHDRRDSLHLELIRVHFFVQKRKMRSAHASGPEERDLGTDTKTLSSSLHPMVSGGRDCGCCRWHCCQTAAWQLACLMWKESASFVGGRISGINYGLCDSWLAGSCRQCLTFAHCILQMKSSASQEDHLFPVISADPSAKIFQQDSMPNSPVTPIAGMESSRQFLKLIPFYVWAIPTALTRWNEQSENLNWENIFTKCFKSTPNTQLR